MNRTLRLTLRLLIFGSLLAFLCLGDARNQMARSQAPQSAQGQANKSAADKVIAEAERLRNAGSADSLRRAIGQYEEALKLYRAAHDKGSEAATLNSIGLVYDSLGQKERALESFNQALPILRKIADRSGEAVVLGNIGLIYSSLGERERALDFYNQALPILRAAGNADSEGNILNNIGRIYDSLSNRQKALELYNQALARWKASGNVAGEARTLTNIGSTYEALGEAAKALEYYQQALALLTKIGDRSGEATTLNNIGFLHYKRSEAAEALRYYVQALSIWRALGDRDREAVTRENIADVYPSRVDQSRVDQSTDIQGSAAMLRTPVVAARRRSRSDRKPTLHILAIGIDHYPHGPRRTRPGMKYPLWNLTTCVKDARDLATTLETAAKKGFEKVDTNLLINSTRVEILDAFEKVIHDIKPQDTFIFSYSGQGLSVPTTNRGKREFYLMPTNFNARVGLPGGISATLLRTLFTKIQAQRRLIILDARESSEGFDSLATSIAEESRSLAGLLERDVALVTLSEGPRISLVEGEGRGNGLLTYALLKGINSSVDTGAKGISVKQLLEYARSYVKQRLPLIPNLDQYQRHVEVRSYFGGNDFPLVYEQTSQIRRAHAYGRAQQGTPQDQPRRPLEIEGRTDTALSRSSGIRKGKDYALLIAGNIYEQWPALSNPVTDATAIDGELKNYYGFETKLVTNPTKTEIVAALKLYKNEIKYGEDDQLFIFIAGHGTFVDDFREGYLVARNSLKDDPDASTYLSHSQLRNIIDQIPCKHIFLVIDACFGGTFDEKIARRGGPEEDSYGEVTNREFVYRKMQFETRQFLTSGGKEYVSDGRPGQHSPFARKFLEALRSYGGSSGILTITRILSYVERVTPEPRRGEFGGNEPGSDFIFVAKPK
jgi:tetratricopeptide (TPR) repeat protein